MMRAIVFLLAVLFAIPAQAGPGFVNHSSGSFSAVATATVGTFTLESATGGTLPFVAGKTFARGAVPTTPSIDVVNSQAEVLSRWPDNSAKLVQFAGRAVLSAGVPLVVTVSNTPVAEGPDLTPADIDAAAPTAVVNLAAVGSSSLASLDLTAPKKIWAQGPEMIEAEYQDLVGDNWITYFVRLFADGRMDVEIWNQSGRFGAQVYLSSFEKNYVPSVSIGGVTVWNNGGASYQQHEWTGWTVGGWIGGASDVVHTPNMAEFSESGAVSRFWKSGPSATALNALYQDYDPGENGQWEPAMGAGGNQPGIAPLPLWDALTVVSNGDARAVNSTFAHARAINSYPMTFLDENTGETVKPTDRPNWTANGNFVGGDDTTNTGGPLTYDLAHHGSAGYLAYLIDPRPGFYKTLRNVAASTCWLIMGPASGGTSRVVGGQDRTLSWCFRSLGQFVGVVRGDDAIGQEYKTVLSSAVSHYLAAAQDPGMNDLGIFRHASSTTTPVDGCVYPRTSGGCGIAPWMNDFGIAALGIVDRLDALEDETNLHALMDIFFQSVLGRLGPGGADAYCYNAGAAYVLTVASVDNYDYTLWFKDGATTAWKQTYDATCGDTPGHCESPLTACSATLRGASGGAPAEAASGYWGQLLSALAAALDYPGTRTQALVALGRVKGASNWSVIDAFSADDPRWFRGTTADFQ